MSDKSLNRAILLNTLTGWIDKIVSILVNFIVRPIIISGLGVSMYGVWEMLNRMTELMASADVRAATTVKWILSINRETESSEILNRSISAGFFASICTLPFYVVLGCMIIYFSPYITKVDDSWFLTVRLSASILLISFIITQIFFIYEQILQGMNIAYKRIGVRACITIAGGLLTYFALKKGFGLLGLVGVNLLVVIVTGISYWLVVRENLRWVKIHRVSLREILSLVKISMDFLIDKLLSIMHRTVDVLLLGYLLSSAVVASYTISSYVMVSLIGFVSMMIASIATGITPLAKENKVSELLSVRSYTYLLLILVYAIASCLTLMFNNSFINLWTQKDLFLGQLDNLLIVLFLFLRLIVDVDKNYICMYLKIKTVNINNAIALALMIVTVFVFIKLFGATGMLVGLILSQICLLSLNAISLKKILQTDLNTLGNVPPRVIVIVIILLLASYIGGEVIMIDDWVKLFGCILSSFCFVAGFIYCLGLDRSTKSLILRQIKKK